MTVADTQPSHPQDDDQAAIETDIATYLASGHTDTDGWCDHPGNTIVEMMQLRSRTLRTALIAKVKQLEAGHQPPPVPADMIAAAWIRARLEPMIHGLFPVAERELVMGLVTRSVVFLDRDATYEALGEEPFLHAAWDIARIWLGSIGAGPLSEEAGGLLGLSQGTTCYVSLEYFDDLEQDEFSDYVVHEVAHIFHNEKRERRGLPLRRKSERMLDIEFRKRELFAYSCEVFSRILERSDGKKHRVLS